MKGVNALRKDDGKSKNESEIPTGAIEALAQTLYPAMVAYFESEEGKREFAEWQMRQGGASLPAGEAKSEGKTGHKLLDGKNEGAVKKTVAPFRFEILFFLLVSL